MNLFNLLSADNNSNGSSSWVIFVVLGVLMIVMFAMSIIPQKKRQKKAQEMMNSIVVGTKVKTIGGFVGEVRKVDNVAGTFTLDISANGDGSMMVLIDKSAVYTVLQAVQAPTGETKLEEKDDTVVAMDDMEADAKKAEKKSKKAKNTEEKVEDQSEDPEKTGDSLEKTDNNTLLKD